jgi:hypothetical protein
MAWRRCVAVVGVAFGVVMVVVAGAAPVKTYNVLVTGYGAFMNHTRNPSSDVAALLDGRCETLSSVRVCFEGWHNVSVDVIGASSVVHRLEELGWRAPWSAVVHLGLESVAKGLASERPFLGLTAHETLSSRASARVH